MAQIRFSFVADAYTSYLTRMTHRIVETGPNAMLCLERSFGCLQSLVNPVIGVSILSSGNLIGFRELYACALYIPWTYHV